MEIQLCLQQVSPRLSPELAPGPCNAAAFCKVPAPRRANISRQTGTSVISIAANLAVSWNGLLKTRDFENPTLTLGSARCSEVWLVGRIRLAGAGEVLLRFAHQRVFSSWPSTQYVAGKSGAQAEVAGSASRMKVLCCPSSPWRQVLCWTFVSRIAAQRLWSWAFWHFPPLQNKSVTFHFIWVFKPFSEDGRASSSFASEEHLPACQEPE